MENTLRYPLARKLKGLLILTRFLPTISWGISAALIGLAFALPRLSRGGGDWLSFVLVQVNIVLFHGVASHAINDLADWYSGTDKLSPGFYSGGSKVIRNLFLREKELVVIIVVSILLGLIISAYLTVKHGGIIILFLLIALWSAISYSHPPFRLSYRPLVGEWLAAFPAVAATTYIGFFVLTGTITVSVIIAGVAHALLSIGLLMVHHITDIGADLMADPPKVTSVAFVAKKFGQKRCKMVAALYFFLTILLSLLAMLFQPILVISAFFALACFFIALKVNPDSVSDVTRWESFIFGLVTAHSIAYLLALNLPL